MLVNGFKGLTGLVVRIHALQFSAQKALDEYNSYHSQTELPPFIAQYDDDSFVAHIDEVRNTFTVAYH